MPGIMVYTEDLEYFEGLLTPQEVGEVLMAVISKSENGTQMPSEFHPAQIILFRMMLKKVERDRKKYYAQAINGRKGGRPKTQQNPTKPNETQANPKNLTVTVPVTVPVTETVTVTETVPVVVTVPTFDEVNNYIHNNNKSINPQKFFDYYQERHWKKKSGAPIDWKAAVDYWEAHEWREENGAGGNQGNPGGSGTYPAGYNPGYDDDAV